MSSTLQDSGCGVRIERGKSRPRCDVDTINKYKKDERSFGKLLSVNGKQVDNVKKSVIMEETSRSFGVITGYRELTSEQKRRAKESSLRLQKHFGFTKTR